MNNYFVAVDRFGNYDISHSGVKGMKWGVRRYQNEDGTLTEAGKKRYSQSGYVKGLNRLAGDVAMTKHKSALLGVKQEKAISRGDKDKAKELAAKRKELDKSVSSGEKEADRILKEAKKNGIHIGARDTKRYTNTGDMMVAAFIAGPFGTIPIAVRDAYRATAYGNEAGGVVDSKQYYRRRA